MTLKPFIEILLEVARRLRRKGTLAWGMVVARIQMATNMMSSSEQAARKTFRHVRMPATTSRIRNVVALHITTAVVVEYASCAWKLASRKATAGGLCKLVDQVVHQVVVQVFLPVLMVV
jgi:hypothetical protein